MTAGAEREVVVEALGRAGDGVGPAGGGERLFVPGALPGERWRVRLDRRVPQGWQATGLACLEAAPRADPPCPHFGRCGGCRLQHLPEALCAAHRRERVVAALRRRGLPGDEMVGEVRTAPLGSRRRLRLGLARAGAGRLLLGFRRRDSHRLEPIAACPIARPELVAALAPLAAELAAALERPEPAEASLTATVAGLDLLLHAGRQPRPAERVRMAAVADRLDLARVAWDDGAASPEPIVTRRAPVVRLGGVPVEPPPGAFLQATAFGEAELAAAVAEWGRGARRAVDLYAGLGALGLELAAGGARVHAVEGDAAAATALRRAAAGLGGRLTVEARDLARRPLLPAELDRHDLVVLDPPRAGAAEQARQLAAARVPTVAYASCSPESFARDARTLVDGGYALLEVRPIDQFRYAAEVELVARFARAAPAPKRP